MRILKWLGITKAQHNIQLKIAFEKLQFLATEMKRGNDRKSDVRFWKEELALVNSIDTGRDFAVRRAKEAYEVLFHMFIEKHELKEEEIALIEQVYQD